MAGAAAPHWVGDAAAHTQVTPRPIGAWEPADTDPDQLGAATPPYRHPATPTR